MSTAQAKRRWSTSSVRSKPTQQSPPSLLSIGYRRQTITQDLSTMTCNGWQQPQGCKATELEGDYSHYKFEYEENQTHIHIEGILKEKTREGARALGRRVTTKREPKCQREKGKLVLYTKRWKECLLSCGKTLEAQWVCSQLS